MTALYQRVAEDILARVRSGALPVGAKLPPEADYAAELGISRATLRMAFAELERLGVLQRKKRAGTRIISDRPKPQFSMSTTGLHELLSLGRDTELAITGTRRVPTGAIPHLAGFESEAEQWLEIAGTRTLTAERTPFNMTRVYVPDRFAGIAATLGDTETSVFQIIERDYQVSVGRVCQAAKAIPCPDDAAAIIGLAPGAPALQILAELTTRDDTLMEVSVAIFDPNRFQLRTDVEID